MIFKYSYLILLLALLAVGSLQEQCTESDEQFYITFHPHLDAFWLNTDDELKDINFRPAGFLYAMNQRNSKTIFNSMLDGLLANPLRKFFVTEIVFLKDWYDYLSHDKKEKVKQLIKNGQLEITNGGWVQNDEAVCYVDDIIDQYTTGQNWLYKEFGEITKIGWATDSFGHSHSQVALEHLLGFEFQGIERIDDRYIYQRKGDSLLQFYWSAVSDSNNRTYGGVYTHVRHFLHEYVSYRNANPFSIAEDHKGVEKTMKKLYRKNKLFRFVGNDFEEFIEDEFGNLEKALNKMNQGGKSSCAHYKWGNPSDYFKWANNSKAEVPVRASDFMPNYDQDHYWSGYYTSNPELKIICKDFSRILNLFRKIYTKYRLNGSSQVPEYRKLLEKADELVSVIQHHDGITATSKYHIEELFKRRMKQSEEELVVAIKKINSLSSPVCQLFNNGNKCVLSNVDGPKLNLKVFHEGASKVDRIELVLPAGKYYQAQIDQQDSIFCNEKSCSLIFDAALQAGENNFILNSVESSNSIIFNEKTINGLTYQGSQFNFQVSKYNLKYVLKDGQHITISLARSANQGSTTDTTAWDKYGNPNNKQERRIPGIYIMANNGQLDPVPEVLWEHIKVIEGKHYTQITVSSKTGDVVILVNHKQINVINVVADFTPPTRSTYDYFLKIDSTLKPDGVYYHDMNGYLVSQRKVGQRLDYNWKYKKEDKINANTYPMCSFGYILQDDKKLVVFTDRAQGFTLYDDSLLVNIDRLANDDYKGVGQGYNFVVHNTFRFKIGLVAKTDYVQRLWQRQYDEALLGFVQNSPSSQLTSAVSYSSDKSYQMLKYTIFSLNADEFVIRLYNMDEQKSISLKKYGVNEWNLGALGLEMHYTDIKEAFANGIPLGERKEWVKIGGQINIFNAGTRDTSNLLYLEPLQIRSFRINLRSTIKVKTLKKPEQALAEVTVTDAKPLKTAFLRRCF